MNNRGNYLADAEKIDTFAFDKEEGYQIIDVDNDMRLKLSDSTLCHILRDNLGIASPTEVQALDKNQRDVVLEKLLTCGGGIRQISRMTGVSFGIVQKISKRV